MCRYTEIVVKRAAVHVFAPKKGVLMQSTAEIDLDDPVQEFLAAHITKGVADGQALAGKLKVVGPDRTEGICRAIIATGRDFVTRSASLAAPAVTAVAT